MQGRIEGRKKEREWKAGRYTQKEYERKRYERG
jgi:hypothetical protein